MKVICTLPNASELISGVKFAPHPDKPGAMVSENVSDEQAALFASIPGYELVGAKKEPVALKTTTAPAGGAAGAAGGAGEGTGGAAAGGASTGTGTPGDKDGNGVNDADELDALRKEAIALGIPHAEQMGAKKLREKIPAAKAAKDGQTGS